MEERQIILLILVCFRLLQSSKPGNGLMNLLQNNDIIFITNNYCVYTEYTTRPEEQRVGVNETAVFNCHNPSAQTIGWLLNGERVTAKNFNGVTPTQQSTDSGVVYTLTIQAHLIYNESTIQCHAHFDTQEDEITDPVKLFIQGLL